MKIKELKLKNLDVYSMVFSGFLYVVVGTIFLTQKGILLFAVKNLLTLLVLLFVVTAFFQLIGFTPLKKKRLTSIAKVIGFLMNSLFAGLIYFKPELIVGILPILFGLYALVSGVIRFLIYLQYKENDVARRFLVLFVAIVLFILGILIIIHPLASLLPLSNSIGLFFILYGISFIIDSVLDSLPKETTNSFKRRIKISLPVFMVALVPHKMLMKINKAFETKELKPEDLVAYKEPTPYDLEVLVHVTEKGLGMLGHVDIYFDGKLMTYGSYDEKTYKLKGLISDGIFVESPNKDDYITFSQHYMGKTLFGFGLKLNEEQKDRVRSEIADIHKNLYRWKPQSELDKETSSIPDKPSEDYASILYNAIEGTFYKFKKGPFKTYFGLNTNCVLLADKIVGQSGIDIVKIQGIITPGAYFEYFNTEFSKKNSIVISRTIYYEQKK
ncbi:DUF308 domain-containing protein [Carnobacterium sp. TMP28]|uniref:DUF308 domain-containing protein n=1 Tax=Carnobacterium sp. TMP28 TaxID=3397060 RepID=UPI0039E0512F